jgi:dihydrofolate reductase
MKNIIVAYDKNRLIGGGNTLLWQGDMNADIKRFREITTGNVIIMGRKTYDSIGKPLPNRQNIVVSRKIQNILGVQIAQNLEEAYKLSKPGIDIYVIGGGQIFAQSLEGVDNIFATEIDADFIGDIYFPKLSNSWHEESRENHIADEKNKYNYSFVTYSKQI